MNGGKAARCMRMARRGLSIVEVMISLGISATLLTAVAAAFSSSAAIVEHNDRFFRTTQSARVCLNQIMTEIRRAHAVAVPNANRINLITFDNQDRIYLYDPTRREIRLVMDGNTAGGFVLASNVTGMSCAADTRVDNGGILHVTRISATVDVQDGANRVRLSGSASLRREQAYDQ